MSDMKAMNDSLDKILNLPQLYAFIQGKPRYNIINNKLKENGPCQNPVRIFERRIYSRSLFGTTDTSKWL